MHKGIYDVVICLLKPTTSDIIPLPVSQIISFPRRSLKIGFYSQFIGTSKVFIGIDSFILYCCRYSVCSLLFSCFH